MHSKLRNNTHILFKFLSFCLKFGLSADQASRKFLERYLMDFKSKNVCYIFVNKTSCKKIN